MKKRLSSSDSSVAMVSICSSADEKISGANTNSKSNSKHGFQKNQSMLEPLEEEEEEEDCLEETGLVRTEKKKRRLSVVQVKALEKNFEVENKLEPERKVRLAQELGLEPRQVAVWFQNRRARWKTKQLERDYGTLNANYESLKQDYEALQQSKDALVAELRELKSKLEQDQDQDQELLSNEEQYIKSEPEEPKITEPTFSQDCCNKNAIGVLIFGDSKDGTSDSDDSSDVLNDEDTNMNMNNNPNAAISHQQFMPPPSSSSINCFRFTEPDSISATTQKDFHDEHPFVRLEEHNFLGAEEPACNFFCDDQAPTLHWYCSDPWN